jgi:hypothetical protein
MRLQLLVYVYGVVNMLGGNTRNIKKNTEDVIDVSKKVSLEITEKTTYTSMFTYRQLNAGQNHNINISNSSHTLHSVFNANLLISFSFSTTLRHVSATLGHHHVSCC